MAITKNEKLFGLTGNFYHRLVGPYTLDDKNNRIICYKQLFVNEDAYKNKEDQIGEDHIMYISFADPKSERECDQEFKLENMDIEAGKLAIVNKKAYYLLLKRPIMQSPGCEKEANGTDKLDADGNAILLPEVDINPYKDYADVLED